MVAHLEPGETAPRGAALRGAQLDLHTFCWQRAWNQDDSIRGLHDRVPSAPYGANFARLKVPSGHRIRKPACRVYAMKPPPITSSPR